jgi:hypothetical protein
MVYRRDQEPFIARCVDVIAPFGGEVCLVQVHCQPETLRQRVGRADRTQHGKITSVALLDETLRTWELQAPFAAATLGDQPAS